MKFHVWRFAILTVKSALPAEPHTLTISGVRVGPTGHYMRGDEQRKTSFVLAARIEHIGELPSDQGEIVIPQELYGPLQEGIELYANLFAVQFRCYRGLSSPGLYVAVEPVDDSAKEWLTNFTRVKRIIPRIAPRIWPNVVLDEHVPKLLDRMDGVSLLAEALCHSHASGRLHELVRVFERAFAAGPTRVCNELLPSFLAPVGFGYTPDEIHRWLELRDRSVHADRRPDFALEADTQLVVNRVEQAAYDVLFNKAAWRSASTERRDVFHPWFASADADGHEVVLYKGRDVQMEMQAFDGFGAYPYSLKSPSPALPVGWIGAEVAVWEPLSMNVRAIPNDRESPSSPADTADR